MNPQAAQNYLRSRVFTATPEQLQMMLYDGAILAIAEAKSHLAAQRIPNKGQAISRAISIIDEGLRASLDLRRGEIGERRREVVVEDELVHAGTCQPPSAFSTNSRRSWPQKRKRRACCSTTNEGTPKAPSATARSVATRSSFLISAESTLPISP